MSSLGKIRVIAFRSFDEGDTLVGDANEIIERNASCMMENYQKGRMLILYLSIKFGLIFILLHEAKNWV